MQGQISQSNAGSDSSYFLFTPLTTSCVATNAIPIFSIHDNGRIIIMMSLRKKNQGKRGIMFGIPASDNHLF